MLNLWFDAVFRGVRQAGLLVEQGQFVRARMIIKRMSAILRQSFVLVAVRLDIKVRRAKSPPPLTPPRKGAGKNALPLACGEEAGRWGVAAREARYPLWTPVQLPGRHPVFAAGEAHDPGLRHLAFPKSLDQGLGLWAPRDDGGAEQSLERKLAALRAALLNPMPYVGRLARKLRSDAILLKPTIPRSIAKTSERDFWEERIAAAEVARLPLGEYWRRRRDSS